MIWSRLGQSNCVLCFFVSPINLANFISNSKYFVFNFAFDWLIESDFTSLSRICDLHWDVTSYRWMAGNFTFALHQDNVQVGFFSMPHILWHVTISSSGVCHFLNVWVLVKRTVTTYFQDQDLNPYLPYTEWAVYKVN